jgi:site-specific recombinase XerC
MKTYGKRSRQLLTDEEMVDFQMYLEAQPTPAPKQTSMIGKRVHIEEPETFSIVCGEGVVERDRGNGCIEVMMETGARVGELQVINKGYVVLDE